MAAHRKPRQRTLGVPALRTAVTLALAGAAGAVAFDGTGQAAPPTSPAAVRAEVSRLYRDAEIATERYNASKEKADSASSRLRELRDEAARRTDRLNTARDALGSLATAQYRAGALSPSLQLALSSDPEDFLERASVAERAGGRQALAVARVRGQLAALARLHEDADDELDRLTARRAELKRQKTAIDGKLRAARRLLAGLTAPQRARIAAADSPSGASRPMPAPGSASSRAAAAVGFAYRALGSPYVWGASGPHAFDCSGLTQAAYRSAGIALPRTTYAQINAGTRVPRTALRPGDLVFFYPGVSHVGLYVGGGQMIHAPRPSSPVRLAPLDQMPFAGATRVA